ncbi:MAG TPA: hypothetical protein VI260_09075 [Blastocatellia bacterium]
MAQIRDRVLPLGATISGVTITDDNSLSLSALNKDRRVRFAQSARRRRRR